eukprot:2354814-Rhodomonas_salina.2
MPRGFTPSAEPMRPPRGYYPPAQLQPAPPMPVYRGSAEPMMAPYLFSGSAEPMMAPMAPQGPRGMPMLPKLEIGGVRLCLPLPCNSSCMALRRTCACRIFLNVQQHGRMHPVANTKLWDDESQNQTDPKPGCVVHETHANCSALARWELSSWTRLTNGE